MAGIARAITGATVALALWASPVRAEAPAQVQARCERAAARSAVAAGVPPRVLQAISLVETGQIREGRLRPWPWVINREGKGYWFRTFAGALAFARASVAAGRTSFDVGCFQINYRWHGENFRSLEEMFDPDIGARYAARFLRTLYEGRGTWSAAAGAYHSQTPEFAEPYRLRFERILAGLAGAPQEFVEADPTEGAVLRKSRTRMSRRPLIITIDPNPAPEPIVEQDALSAELRETPDIWGSGATLASARRGKLGKDQEPLVNDP